MATKPALRPPEGQDTRYRPQPLGGHANLPTWSDIAARNREHVPDLVYPASIDTFDRMRNDDQVTALEQEFFQPIHAWDWYLDPGSLPTEAARRLADDLDLPLSSARGEDQGTRRFQVGWHRVLDHAITSCLQGVAVCEIVGATPKDPEYEDGWWRLRRLAPIELADLAPWSWNVDDDGSLLDVTFQPNTGAPIALLRANRLQRWSWKAPQGTPIGRSMLRSLYRAWLIKDELIRVDAIRHNKAATGTWVGTLAEGDGDDEQADMEAMLSQTAVGEHTYMTVRAGQSVKNEGVTGQTTDPVASIKMHDAAMAKAWGAQIIELGQSASGNRALGESFERLQNLSREAVAAFIAEELTRQTVSRWVEWNGLTPDVAPKVLVDPPCENEKPPEPAPVEVTTDPVVAAARAGQDESETPVRGVPQAVRPLTPAEQESRFDFAAIHAAWVQLRDWLVAQWRQIRTAMIDAGIEAVSSIRDLENRFDQVADLVRTAALGTLAADRVDELADRMAATADEAARQIQTAARAAGLDPDPIEAGYRDRAVREVNAVAQELAYTTAAQVQRRAQNLASVPNAAAAIAADLAELTDAQLNDIAGASATRAQHAGQFSAYEQAEDNGEIREIYYSALLDGRTCGPCGAADGREYLSLAAAAVDFPSSGYRDCEGGPRCRCLPVIVWETEQEVDVR